MGTAVINAEGRAGMAKRISASRIYGNARNKENTCCLFVFLALQTIVVVSSQPGSGL